MTDLPKSWHEPAFPNIRDLADDSSGLVTLTDAKPGMSKGEFFTAMAMAGLLGNADWLENMEQGVSENCGTEQDLQSFVGVYSSRFARAALLELERLADGTAD